MIYDPEMLIKEKVLVKNLSENYWHGPFTLISYDKSLPLPYIVEEQGEHKHYRLVKLAY